MATKKTCKKCSGIVTKSYSSKDHCSDKKVWKCACCYDETPVRSYNNKKRQELYQKNLNNFNKLVDRLNKK